VGELFFGPDGLVYGLARLAVTGALLAGAIVIWWRREEASVVAALGLLPIVLAAAVWAAGQPIFDERNLLPVAPFLAILVAAGVTALPARLVPVAAAVGIVAALCGAAYSQLTLGRVATTRSRAPSRSSAGVPASRSSSTTRPPPRTSGGSGSRSPRRRLGTSPAARCSRGRRAAATAAPASRSCSRPIRSHGSRATAAE
jgi:hypothetical protein